MSRLRWLGDTAALARAVATTEHDVRGAAREIFYAVLTQIPGSYPRYEMRRHPDAPSLTLDPRIVVIEGFHGSANSWSTYVVFLANRDRPLAHHRHRPAPLLEGVRRGLPCLCLIRDPIDAIASIVIRKGLHPAVELKRYIHFYEACLPVAERLEVMTFTQATTEPAGIIDRLNRRFDAGLNPFDSLGDDPVAVVRAKMSQADRYVFGEEAAKLHGAAPSEARAEGAADVRQTLSDPRFATDLERCRQLYRHYAALAETQAAWLR